MTQGNIFEMKRLLTLAILGLALAAFTPNSLAAGCGGCSGKDKAENAESKDGTEAKEGCQG